MSLPIEFRNVIRRTTEDYVKKLIQTEVKPHPQSTRKWKFSNSADFHYGHFVGMMEMNATSVFPMFYQRQLNPEEMQEVEEIIEELGKPFREYLQKTF